VDVVPLGDTNVVDLDLEPHAQVVHDPEHAAVHAHAEAVEDFLPAGIVTDQVRDLVERGARELRREFGRPAIEGLGLEDEPGGFVVQLLTLAPLGLLPKLVAIVTKPRRLAGPRGNLLVGERRLGGPIARLGFLAGRDAEVVDLLALPLDLGQERLDVLGAGGVALRVLGLLELLRLVAGVGF